MRDAKLQRRFLKSEQFKGKFDIFSDDSFLTQFVYQKCLPAPHHSFSRNIQFFFNVFIFKQNLPNFHSSHESITYLSAIIYSKIYPLQRNDVIARSWNHYCDTSVVPLRAKDTLHQLFLGHVIWDLCIVLNGRKMTPFLFSILTLCTIFYSRVWQQCANLLASNNLNAWLYKNY